MRVIMLSMLLALSACASNVYDSLDRRGIDSADIFAQRVSELNLRLGTTRTEMEKAGAAMAAINGQDGAALSRSLTIARAAYQDALAASENMRLASDSMSAAASRYFSDRERDISLLPEGGESARAAQAQLQSVGAAYNTYLSHLKSARVRLSPAITVYGAEVETLRRSPTSGAVAASRASSRDAIAEAILSATSNLDLAIESGNTLMTALGQN